MKYRQMVSFLLIYGFLSLVGNMIAARAYQGGAGSAVLAMIEALPGFF